MTLSVIQKGQEDHYLGNVVEEMSRGISPNDEFRNLWLSMFHPQHGRPVAIEKARQLLEDQMPVANAIARAYRANTRAKQFKSRSELLKDGAISKSQLDVGTVTNMSAIVGGQTMGYVSLDTQMARGTVRPNSFTLYQSLHKSAAYQVVDFWPYAYDTGGGLPGTAFQGFGNVASGTLSTSAGKYAMQALNLKLMVNGRAITTALAAQNSFVDITAQENINAALTVLESANYACYYGDPTFYANQFTGIAAQIPAANIFDFQDWYNNYAVTYGWSQNQALFNLIYDAAAKITSYRQFGRITHAFMSPITAGALQSLVTTVLNNIVTQLTPSQERLTGIVVDGDLQGMRTRFGEIQFPIDLYIGARQKAAQAIIYEDGTNAATVTGPTKPVSVTAAISGVGASGAAWTAAYTATSGIYSYAVASMDASMNESTLTFLTGMSVSGVTATGAYVLTITPPGSADATAFRIYRSGLGYNPASSGVANVQAYRHVGTVLASGASAVTWSDYNTKIPGADQIFLLDLDENDGAIDFRYLLPLTKVELFAQNLYMPWAVCMIGSIRLKIPKFHGMIRNFVPDNAGFNPLAANTNAAG